MAAVIRCVVWLATLVTVSLCSIPSQAQAQGVSESALKAGYLLNFIKFTEWPTDVLAPSAPLALCTTDPDVAAALEAVVGQRSVEQRAVQVRRVTLEDPLRGCGLLYVGRLDRRRAIQLGTALQGASVLSVGDDEAFAAGGGVIGLYVEGDRLRFAINPASAERQRLKLSARLLSLAKLVKGEPW